jgi:polyisoprenyl-phosphate glycosyltransferase
MQERRDASPRLWIVTPVFFDVESFMILRERIHEIIPADVNDPGYELTLVAVDDSAGRDDQIAKLTHLSDVRVVSPPFNVGHQRAIVYGLRCLSANIADEDLVVTMDADGEDQPEDMARLLAPLTQGVIKPRTVCIARRTKRREPIQFRIWYVAFRVLFRALTGSVVRSGNYAAYRGDVVHTTLRHPSFDLCYSSTLVSLDIPVFEVRCARGVRYAGRSRMNRTRLFMHGLRMLMPFLDRIAVRALFLFSAVLALSMLGAVAIVGVRVFTDNAIPGWATFTLLSALLLSLTALGSFVVLFATFSQSRAVSLQSLETDLRDTRGPRSDQS